MPVADAAAPRVKKRVADAGRAPASEVDRAPSMLGVRCEAGRRRGAPGAATPSTLNRVPISAGVAIKRRQRGASIAARWAGLARAASVAARCVDARAAAGSAPCGTGP